ncbi:phosphoribosylamine--glycine ligase [Caulobacter rhizosphaerae]|jgi:phosphoribosylamine--glycine ligase|uniref:Phosphoribosylamine--glycine ligase n=1 Tax=Caulobacter rhizosphaerae TaxID=2010972 RepID=A0ABU1MXA8_9CAUL|nr:phosphoribosylamine--glycine ligase [Caulobacter rhizosphaerae]MDR6530490.1 phosphoribosylamine--glycine ligase [Caulobacter rhizosphaerae]GGL30956.1 phosphoribosylamine--glycine ligase [Caulobacter rhizosphaerae]
MEKLNILLVGSGGREHALAWKIAQSPLCGRLVAAPGNPGVEQVAELRPVKVTDVDGLVALAREIAADLVVVGPESALEVGLADELAKAGIPCFGGSALAARLETSKAFTKDFCARHGLPTAAYGVFTDAASAGAFLDTLTAPFVIKADGLAAGKGVVIAADRAEADAAVLDMLGGRFGSAGARVVIEEFMHGEEASLFAICDGQTAVLFGAAQDHKRAYDGDEGPNTGGMGTYSPPPVLTPALVDQAWRELVLPTIAGMAAEGCPYVGVLYAGLMLTEQGPKLVEYNARFGDPECQTLMLRLESDLVPLLLAAAKGELASAAPPVWREEAAICVVLAAEGYPDAPKTGGLIQGADSEFGGEAVIFHAGTARDAEGRLVASGGRVLNVCALGATLHEARDVAYAALGAVSLEGGFYRTDIGWRALSQH